MGVPKKRTSKMKRDMRRPLFIDLRNVYDPRTMREAGFAYFCVGRCA